MYYAAHEVDPRSMEYLRRDIALRFLHQPVSNPHDNITMSLPNLFITLFSLLTSLAYASHPRSNITRTCGSASSPHLLQHAAEFAVLDLSDEEILSGTISPRSQKRHVIETYFHVLAANKTLEGGWVPKELLKKQLEVIQDNFKPSKFAFKLKGTTYSIYSNWTATGPDLKTRKKLRKGTRQTLNVYIVSQFEEYLQTGVIISSRPLLPRDDSKRC